LHNGLKDYIINTKNALLSTANVNVVVVDWSKGKLVNQFIIKNHFNIFFKGNGLPYTQATANTQIVGADIALLISSLIVNKNAKAANFHCIGHSLGKPICFHFIIINKLIIILVLRISYLWLCW
jgi:pancreatic triacylglycerol lipase